MALLTFAEAQAAFATSKGVLKFIETVPSL
jgi:hypothetical protein